MSDIEINKIPTLRFCEFLDNNNEFELSDIIQAKISNKNIKIAQTNNTYDFEATLFKIASYYNKFNKEFPNNDLIRIANAPLSLEEAFDFLEELGFQKYTVPTIQQVSDRVYDLTDPLITNPNYPTDTALQNKVLRIQKLNDALTDTNNAKIWSGKEGQEFAKAALKAAQKAAVPALRIKTFDNVLQKLKVPDWAQKMLKSKAFKFLGVAALTGETIGVVMNFAENGWEALSSPKEIAQFVSVLTGWAGIAANIFPPPAGTIISGILKALSTGAGLAQTILPGDR